MSYPPKKGQGAVPTDLDKNPKTTDWTFPCTCRAVGAAFPQCGTMTTAWGARNPTPGVPATGANSAFIWMLYCLVATTPEPSVQRKPIGTCMWPKGRKTRSVANGHAIWISCNPDDMSPDFSKSYEFDTDLATCMMKISKDNDGNRTFETPERWSMWPAGA